MSPENWTTKVRKLRYNLTNKGGSEWAEQEDVLVMN